MKTITLDELAGYREDPKSLRNFERAYLPPSLLGVIFIVAGLVLFVAESNSGHSAFKGGFTDAIWIRFKELLGNLGIPVAFQAYAPFAIFSCGVLLFLGTILWMRMATPRSAVSGLKMEKYSNASPTPGVSEIIYVDRSSKTYFRRVFATRSRRQF
jgi:hypothetical protein